MAVRLSSIRLWIVGTAGVFVDEFLRRLGNVETDVKELRTDVSELKVGMEALRGDVKAILAVIPHLATKADLGEVKTLVERTRTETQAAIAGMIKWMVGTVVAAAGAAFSLAKLVH